MSHQHEKMMGQASGQKTLSGYITGLALSIILTLLAFGIVEKRLLSDANLYIALTVLAVAQLFVQSICFLRLNCSTEGRWNLFPFIFTVLIIAIIVGGSLWIMYNLNINMS
ncbi:cytochrome o ubiquinol oxidase subunit IV [Aquicella lusitana]|uniref:Cytochrome bo(3) ubiquinol oxidase subunit 4 n=1 Tax=Aquicella lusitana TaxID=254246 RepID=A0A370GHW8_9COXI|nr:cytochrome o ubiquinol oxidase subunit IV [Aquicella lusitana]RDI43398.1 cytochrome bo3 quinol oxidase subunit 4 [Aquicella lusitana]VVC73548.1 Cytochrome bo(3) ubiquinol oxidase subunit 4 [Aquicella lusitana]